MIEIYQKVKTNQYTKIILALLITISLLLLYNIYLWFNTQSTDNAYIEADISTISSEISGVIEEILVTENNIVEAGQIIARIDASNYRAKYEQAVANFKMSQHNIETITKNIKLALIEQEKAQEAQEFAAENHRIIANNYQRALKLNKDNFASIRNVDDSKIAYQEAKHILSQTILDVQISQQNIELLEIKKNAALAESNKAREEKRLARRALDKTNIKAPIAGIIGNNSLRFGSFVRPAMPLFSIIPLDKFYVKANFKETQIIKLKPNMEAIIKLDTNPNVKIKGVIRSLSPATGSKFSLLPPSNATGNFTKIVQRVPVTIDFKVPDVLRGKIRPGMSTLISVRTDQDISDQDVQNK